MKFNGVVEQCIFAGKPVLKIILYWKGLIQGYNTYGGSGSWAPGTALEVLKGLEVLEVDTLEDDTVFDLAEA